MENGAICVNQGLLDDVNDETSAALLRNYRG
jgi:hypothetical protein